MKIRLIIIVVLFAVAFALALTMPKNRKPLKDVGFKDVRTDRVEHYSEELNRYCFLRGISMVQRVQTPEDKQTLELVAATFDK